VLKCEESLESEKGKPEKGETAGRSRPTDSSSFILTLYNKELAVGVLCYIRR
jgi:hypothetical protein